MLLLPNCLIPGWKKGELRKGSPNQRATKLHYIPAGGFCIKVCFKEEKKNFHLLTNSIRENIYKRKGERENKTGGWKPAESRRPEEEEEEEGAFLLSTTVDVCVCCSARYTTIGIILHRLAGLAAVATLLRQTTAVKIPELLSRVCVCFVLSCKTINWRLKFRD